MHSQSTTIFQFNSKKYKEKLKRLQRQGTTYVFSNAKDHNILQGIKLFDMNEKNHGWVRLSFGLERLVGTSHIKQINLKNSYITAQETKIL